jgi:voltage-gated potassium channel
VTSHDDAVLAAWKHRMDPVVMAAAILPVAVGLLRGRDTGPAVVIDLVSWSIFVADLLVRMRFGRSYLRTRGGVFDIVIVVLTAPWYLLPGVAGARFLSVGRLARIGRVFVVSRNSHRMRALGRRLGQAMLYSSALLGTCAVIVHAAEPERFESFGDAAWWALVTFTTVGYGDLYPVTGTGRVAGALLMVGGIALIGSLAASLGSFFGSADGDEHDADDASDGGVNDPAVQQQILDELRQLRTEVSRLHDRE